MHNSLKLEATHISINSKMGKSCNNAKWNTTQPLRKEWNTLVHNNMDESTQEC